MTRVEQGSVDARLRELATLSGSTPAWPNLVDMAPDAVTARLSECAEISALTLDLQRAGERAGLAPKP